MKKVLVPLGPGFEEIEATTVIDVLRRAGLEVTVAGTSAGPMEGSRGIKVVPDKTLDQVSAKEFDLIVVPGGAKGVQSLGAHGKVPQLLGEFTAQGKYVAAICAAPSLLAKTGLICGKQVTSHPSVKEEVSAASFYTDERVAVDGKLITSRGPGTAMEFALKLVEILVGKEKVQELKTAMLVA